ncbi:RDD family protein [Phenylobacterium aquaticum]|uniref:RDD family protein n=1 Tax=Phenylobacterium aquaticum TaxID=1763816 RepID=UPI001F5C8241|nr:RDD family protein [Phenylobacterium aquaticum]MCI3134888.1 RDD family protein [Phenylobacterium aquaticum]
MSDAGREFVTPEGVDLRLKVGAVSERAGALVIDLLIIMAALILLTILVGAALWVSNVTARSAPAVIWLLGFFLLRNFYFTGFELTPAAATPGKRVMKLRVIARNGGRLTADAVFGRNAMRELELYLPMIFMLSRGQGVDAWVISLGCLWSLVFLLFPLFNRDHLRAGDLIAGTMVVRAPKPILAPDLSRDGAVALNELRFTDEQLSAYGIKELQVLESVLRSNDRKTLAEVARRIRGKIGWIDEVGVSDRAFLTGYYAALRGRLERQMLFGRRRADKFDAG